MHDCIHLQILTKHLPETQLCHLDGLLAKCGSTQNSVVCMLIVVDAVLETTRCHQGGCGRLLAIGFRMTSQFIDQLNAVCFVEDCGVGVG